MKIVFNILYTILAVIGYLVAYNMVIRIERENEIDY